MKLHFQAKRTIRRSLKLYSYLRNKVHLCGDNRKQMFHLDKNEQINKIVGVQYVTTANAKVFALISYDSLVISRLSQRKTAFLKKKKKVW